MPNTKDAATALGRLFLAMLFVLSGLSKLAAPAAIQGYIASAGLPAPAMVYGVALGVELVGGAFLIAGLQTRFAAAALAVFSIAAAALFHNQFADQNHLIHFLKNIAIAGGLLQLAVYGGGAWSVDGVLARRPKRAAAA